MWSRCRRSQRGLTYRNLTGKLIEWRFCPNQTVMIVDPKIQANTRYAFVCMALMLLAFLVFALMMLVPLGLSMNHHILAIRISLYAVVLFAILSGIFSIRVALLRKNSGKVIK